MFQFKGKSSNVFDISINYPPNEDEKEDIKRMNTEDIFPENIAAPNIELDLDQILNLTIQKSEKGK